MSESQQHEQHDQHDQHNHDQHNHNQHNHNQHNQHEQNDQHDKQHTEGGASFGYSSLTGGAGASDYMKSVAGDMNNQHAGTNGAIQYSAPPTQMGGIGLAEMVVPATLVLTNQVLHDLMKKRGGSGEKLEETQEGGVGLTEVAVPVVLLLGSQLAAKHLSRKNQGGNAPETKHIGGKKKRTRRNCKSRGKKRRGGNAEGASKPSNY